MSKEKSRLEVPRGIIQKFAKAGYLFKGKYNERIRRIAVRDVVTEETVVERPPVQARSVEPRAENYLIVEGRATSKGIHDNGYLVMDFTRDGVLKESVPFHLPQGAKRVPVFSNHTRNIFSTIGQVRDAWYGEPEHSLTTPGVNTQDRINVLRSPEIADMLLDGDLVSSSMTDEWEFEISHPDLGHEFWYMMGEEVNGETVRLIVTEYFAVYERSYVWQGADIEGKLFSVRFATEAEIQDVIERYTNGFTSSRSKLTVPGELSNSRELNVNDGDAGSGDATEAESEVIMNDAERNKLAEALGVRVVTEVDAPQKLDELIADRAQKAEKLSKTEKDLGLERQGRAEDKAFVEAGKKYLERDREEVLKSARLFYKADEKEVPESVSERVKNADFTEIEDLADIYGAKLRSKEIPESLRRSSLDAELDSETETSFDEKALPDLSVIKRKRGE